MSFSSPFNKLSSYFSLSTPLSTLPAPLSLLSSTHPLCHSFSPLLHPFSPPSCFPPLFHYPYTHTHTHELLQENTHREAEESAQVFRALVRCVEGSQASLVKEMEEKQAAVERWAQRLLQELEKESTELKVRRDELKKQQKNDDHIDLLQVSITADINSALFTPAFIILLLFISLHLFISIRHHYCFYISPYLLLYIPECLSLHEAHVVAVCHHANIF